MGVKSLGAKTDKIDAMKAEVETSEGIMPKAMLQKSGMNLI